MTQQIKSFTTEIKQSIQLNYLLHLPTGVEDGEKRPFILFLHGAGERGDDLDLVRLHGVPKIIDGDLTFPFITVSPQCPELYSWFLRQKRNRR